MVAVLSVHTLNHFLFVSDIGRWSSAKEQKSKTLSSFSFRFLKTKVFFRMSTFYVNMFSFFLSLSLAHCGIKYVLCECVYVCPSPSKKKLFRFNVSFLGFFSSSFSFCPLSYIVRVRVCARMCLCVAQKPKIFFRIRCHIFSQRAQHSIILKFDILWCVFSLFFVYFIYVISFSVLFSLCICACERSVVRR